MIQATSLNPSKTRHKARKNISSKALAFTLAFSLATLALADNERERERESNSAQRAIEDSLHSTHAKSPSARGGGNKNGFLRISRGDKNEISPK